MTLTSTISKQERLTQTYEVPIKLLGFNQVFDVFYPFRSLQENEQERVLKNCLFQF